MFLVVGLIGLGLLLFSLVFDEVFDSFVPDIDWLSIPVIGATTAGFGLSTYIIDRQTSLPIGMAIGIAAFLAATCGLFTIVFSKSVIDMPTDPTPSSDNLMGSIGRVVTDIGPDAAGEVLVTLGGQPVKVFARSRSNNKLAVGGEVIVVAVQSETSVTVESASTFWSENGNTKQ